MDSEVSDHAATSAGQESPTSNDEGQQARTFLTGLIGKTLRIQISDGRMFSGEMKCTDKDKNVILGNTTEFRELHDDQRLAAQPSTGTARAAPSVTHRFVGMVVIPGEHILRIEKEEFDRSQII